MKSEKPRSLDVLSDDRPLLTATIVEAGGVGLGCLEEVGMLESGSS